MATARQFAVPAENNSARSRFERTWKKVNELKSLSDCVSPASWALIVIAFASELFILLEPSIWEFLVLVAVDSIAYGLVATADRKIFPRLYPDSKFFLDGGRAEDFARLSPEERFVAIKAFMTLPARRAIGAFIVSLIKSVPAILIFVYYWRHPDRSNWAQLALTLGICSVNFAYFSTCVLIETHIFVSQRVQDLHERFDLSEIFARIETPFSRRDFDLQEVVGHFSITMFILVLQAIVVSNGAGISPWTLASHVIAVGILGGMLLMRIFALNRKFLFGALERLFRAMEGLDYHKAASGVSLHSSPILARFEKSYNLLTSRLRNSEQALAASFVEEIEKSRFRAIGEMSSLIAHDLSGPLHSAHFCVTELSELENSERREIYLQRARSNLDRAIELITSLKARVRNPSGSLSGTVEFANAHNRVLKLLELQHLPGDFKRVRFELDPRAASAQVGMSSSDLIHVLDNLYRNSLKSFIEVRTGDPVVRSELVELTDERAVFRISDNGGGLDRHRFELLTAYQFSSASTGRVGLGLRLTRRLGELHGGQLRWTAPRMGRGTALELELPIKPALSAHRNELSAFTISIRSMEPSLDTH